LEYGFVFGIVYGVGCDCLYVFGFVVFVFFDVGGDCVVDVFDCFGG